MEQDNILIYGIRHLSPAGAWHLKTLLDRVQPELVLIEGPSDFNDQMAYMAAEGTKPPIAMLAYTKETPIRTILYPFAEYSPEYEAIRWCFQHNVECKFIDLPSEVVLALRDITYNQKEKNNTSNEQEESAASNRKKENTTLKEQEKKVISNQKEKNNTSKKQEESAVSSEQKENTISNQKEENVTSYIYKKLDEYSGENSHEVFWERYLEHNIDENAYLYGAREFGMQLRKLTEGMENDYAETIIREAYMKRQIELNADKKIVVVTGAYHVAGLQSKSEAMTEEEYKMLPKVESAKTLMPYSYYRLSTLSGYGAGNKAPAYYELLYEGLQKKDHAYASYKYLSKIASYQRKYGHMVSSAEVIEAVQLAMSLANLHGGTIPTLQDLKDAAVTCMGHGYFSEISLAVADTEIGTKIGNLPEGISRTSIQEDFYYRLKELRLEKYKSMTAEELQLDLREKLNVKSEKVAFIDLQRSFFLHRLRILSIHFAELKAVNQEKATWAEHWVLQWTPEAEIEIVETALKGDTIELATAFLLKERVEHSSSIAEIARVIEDAFFCGMTSSMIFATEVLQRLSTEAAAIGEIGKTAKNLSIVVQYGSIRKLDSAPLKPILEQLFFRGCLLLSNCCLCDNQAVTQIIEVINQLNEVAIANDFLNQEQWIQVLEEIAKRDDLNTKASGYAMAILLERSKISTEQLAIEVQRRLSKGIPADLGACWFEGLSMKNRYALIARISLWKELSDYLDSLDNEEFKRALVFLRRAFADFTAKEKNDIAENLGELWNLNPQAVSEVLNGVITAEEQENFGGLDEFDFEDI